MLYVIVALKFGAHHFQVTHCKLLAVVNNILHGFNLLLMHFLLHFLAKFGEAALCHVVRSNSPLLSKLWVQIVKITVEVTLHMLGFVKSLNAYISYFQIHVLRLLFFESLAFLEDSLLYAFDKRMLNPIRLDPRNLLQLPV